MHVYQGHKDVHTKRELSQLFLAAMTGGQGFAHVSSHLQAIFGALRNQASDVVLTGIPEQQSAKTRDRRISDQPKRGKTTEFFNSSPLTQVGTCGAIMNG